MKIRNLFLILLAQTLGWTGISAQSIDAEDAAARARDFFQRQQSTTVGVHKAQAMVKPVLAYTATTANTPDFYVFNRAADLPGFVIVNADATSTTEILGYSEMSTFDYDTAPDNFKWWLQQYQTNGVAKAPAKAPGMRHDVPYLCQTKWNQNAPYWNKIPYTGTAHYVTGCAATSMAQVMKYFNYPERGEGSYGYSINYGTVVNYSADFANTTYDWANMLDDYSHGYNDAQADAVATLMYHCGVAQDMEYNNSLRGGSSAIVGRNGRAMIDYFKYDKSMVKAVRQYYTDEAWEELMYNEVDKGRPVLYSGQSSGGGHSFICDGYRVEDNTYHINWGWGGYLDGYFILVGKDGAEDPEVLNPDGSGIGGSSTSDGYSGRQSAIVNIKPNEGGGYASIICLKEMNEISRGAIHENLGSAAFYDYKVNLSDGFDKNLYVTITAGNEGFSAVGFDFGVMFRNVTTGAEYAQKLGTREKLDVNYMFGRQEPFSTSILPEDGVYEVIPVFRELGTLEWEKILCEPTFKYARLTLTGTANRPDPNVITLKDELCFDQFPVVGSGNVVTESNDFKITFSMLNNTDSPVSDFFVMFLTVGNHTYYWRLNGNNMIASGGASRFTINLGDNISLCTPGELYTFSFYHDVNRTQSMNVPSVTFYYAKPGETNISEITDLIELAKQGEGNDGIIRSLVNKVLKR